MNQSKQRNRGRTGAIITADEKEKGMIISFSARRCMEKGCDSMCCSVIWENGKRSYPCVSKVKPIGKGRYQLLP